ncbi:MAG: ATP-binding protein [Methanobacteriota archaeon]|nr:MAG: ATP-binding protein [Euryarchaeota archaeon]
MQERRKKFEEQDIRIKERMGKIKHKLVVLSGKGGVGKSTVTANLAVMLAKRGSSVGVLDGDITGPCIPQMLGAKNEKPVVTPTGLSPVVGVFGVRIVSMDYFLASETTPVIWRGPLKTMAIRQFLADIEWGPLDFLLVDLPPGTGDEALSVIQFIPNITGVIIVTIPSKVSQIVVKKAVMFSKKLNTHIIGLIENMSGFVCPSCGASTNIFQVGGGEKICRELGISFLGAIPLDPRICDDMDRGKPFIAEHPDSPPAKAFTGIVDKIVEVLGVEKF